MIDLYFVGMIYEGIIILIALPLVFSSLKNYINVHNRLSLLLFLILLNYCISIIFSWLSKVLHLFSNIDYLIYENVLDPNTIESWFLLRISDFRITHSFIIIAIYLSFFFKNMIFGKENNLLKKYVVEGYAIFILFFTIFIYQKENVLLDVLTFFFVFIFMMMVYLPFLLEAIKAYKTTDHSGFRKSFLSLSLMSLFYISVLLCLLIDRIFIFLGSFGFTFFYFLTWAFVIAGIISTYYGYLKLDLNRG